MKTTNQKNEIRAVEGTKFKIHAKRLILTYPIKDHIKKLEKSQVIELLRDKFNHLAAKIEYLCVAFERGEKENYAHMHVTLRCDRLVRIRNQAFLDINGVHGNYKAIDRRKDSWMRTLNYVQKDGDYEI